MSRASSRSLAVAGSMVKTRLSLRSSRTSHSRSGILLVTSGRLPLCTTHLQGRGGRHLMASSLNSSVGKLQSLSKALVSTSASPIGPSSSTRVPKGCREVLQVSFDPFWCYDSLHWPSLDGSDKQPLRVRIGIIDKVRRSLFGRNSNKRYPFIGRFEPNNPWFGFGFIPPDSITFSFSSFNLLLFLGCSR